MILHFDPGSVRFIAQSKVNRQITGCTPVILDIRAKNAGALSPLATADASAVVDGQSQVKISTAVASSAAGSRCRRSEYSAEVDAAQCSIVTRVEGVDAIAPEFKSGVEDMAVVRHDDRI